jgi:hypothetical protein
MERFIIKVGKKDKNGVIDNYLIVDGLLVKSNDGNLLNKEQFKKIYKDGIFYTAIYNTKIINSNTLLYKKGDKIQLVNNSYFRTDGSPIKEDNLGNLPLV